MASMPNRSQEVAALCAKHPEAFPPGDQNDPSRLKFLQGTIIPELNKLDGGRWGYMTKTDQGGKVPCDILMWRDTNDVVDCMTGTGSSWIVHAPPPPAWVWTAVGTTPKPQPPTGGGTTPPSSSLAYDENQVSGFITDVEKAYADAGKFFDGHAGIWVGRMQFDAFSMGYSGARAKHLAALRSSLGLT